MSLFFWAVLQVKAARCQKPNEPWLNIEIRRVLFRYGQQQQQQKNDKLLNERWKVVASSVV